MKILIIDGNSLLHRAYYALPDWRNSNGEATGGVYGFLSMMIKAIEELKPTHLIIVFDSFTGVNFRKQLYVGYHANRDKDEKITKDIFEQVEKLKIVFEKLGVPVFQISGVEADDTIGSITKKVTDEDGKTQVVIVTGDRDLMQLVNQRVNLFMPVKGVSDGQVVGIEEVKQRLGVEPRLVIDYKALVGDASDGYPGVAGIGPKTAIALLNEFGSFEDAVKKSDNKKLSVGIEGGKLSKILATIKTDVDLQIDLDKANIPNEEKLVGVFKELGHKSLIKRMTGEDIKLDDKQPKLFE